MLTPHCSNHEHTVVRCRWRSLCSNFLAETDPAVPENSCNTKILPDSFGSTPYREPELVDTQPSKPKLPN
jgi:hypothetical protein